MKTITATQARRQLLKILDGMKTGETVQVTHRGKAVAQLKKL